MPQPWTLEYLEERVAEGWRHISGKTAEEVLALVKEWRSQGYTHMDLLQEEWVPLRIQASGSTRRWRLPKFRLPVLRWRKRKSVAQESRGIPPPTVAQPPPPTHRPGGEQRKDVAQERGIRVEYRKCGKPNCRCTRGELHGPYRYRQWREDGKVHRQYLGKA